MVFVVDGAVMLRSASALLLALALLPSCRTTDDDVGDAGDVSLDDIADRAADDSALDPDRLLQDLEHLEDEALRAALHERVAGHAVLGYDAARLAMFTEIDVHDGRLECVYSGRTAVPDGTVTPGTFNTEHSWPQSEFGGAEAGASSDLHHLFPTDTEANSARSSYPFGETPCDGVHCSWYSGGSELGPVAGGEALVFEVRPATRGDIARAHFYFAVRYELPIPESEEPFLRGWNAEDPPSVRERDRNAAIEARQHNRNPFVDRPDFVDRIGDF